MRAAQIAPRHHARHDQRRAVDQPAEQHLAIAAEDRRARAGVRIVDQHLIQRRLGVSGVGRRQDREVEHMGTVRQRLLAGRDIAQCCAGQPRGEMIAGARAGGPGKALRLGVDAGDVLAVMAQLDEEAVIIVLDLGGDVPRPGSIN